MQGSKDQVYIRKGLDGQPMYKPKYYLLWTLREILAMLNEELWNENSFKLKFEETLKFSSLYYQQEIPQLTCLCQNVRSLNYFVALNTLKNKFKFVSYLCTCCIAKVLLQLPQGDLCI